VAEPVPLVRPPPQASSAMVRRDRTLQFASLRSTARRFRPRQGPDPLTARKEEEGFDSEPLHSVYQRVSRTHTSLLSKLAQHNGLLQFGMDFHRAPPLEFLTMLPELESSIDGLHQFLADVSTELARIELPPCFEELRGSLVQHVEVITAKTTETFQAQRRDLELLAQKSPLYSPVCPLLLKRLSATTGSGSRGSSPLVSTTTSSQTVSPSYSGASPRGLPDQRPDGPFEVSSLYDVIPGVCCPSNHAELASEQGRCASLNVHDPAVSLHMQHEEQPFSALFTVTVKESAGRMA
jgi:hypothetical protein